MTTESSTETTIVGSGDFVYEAIANFEQLPEGMSFYEVVGTATDSQGRVYAFNRGEQSMIVLDRDGKFVRTWGKDQFVRPHGIWIGPDDTLYLTDDSDHTVKVYTPDGKLKSKLGTSGQPSDTGVEGSDYRMVKQVGPPFNRPTNLALSPDGDMYVSDGYGNARIHKFSSDGRLLLSWGETGSDPGQFQVPHGICVDCSGRVFVADRENNRLQIFSPDGEYLEQWTDVVRPCEVFIDQHDTVYVAELGMRAGMFHWMTPNPDLPGGRVSIFDSQGNLQCRWGGGDNPGTLGDFFAPHDIWVDSAGSIYLSDVIHTGGGKDVPSSPAWPTLQKFVRKS